MNVAEAPATLALIIANVAASLYALYGDRRFIDQFAFEVDAVVRRRQHHLVLTSAFLHGDLAHLLLNMLTLFFFGPAVEAVLGRLGFLVVYFGAAIASGIAMAVVHRQNPSYSAIGASGAVSGVVLSFCVFAPLQPIYIMFIPIGIPAILYGVLYMILSAQMMGAPGARIAHEGHLGGAIAGAVLTILMRPDTLGRLFG